LGVPYELIISSVIEVQRGPKNYIKEAEEKGAQGLYSCCWNGCTSCWGCSLCKKACNWCSYG